MEKLRRWWRWPPILVLRFLVLAAAGSWTIYILAAFRTMEFGSSWRLVAASMVLAAILVLPVAAVTLIGLRRRRYLMGLVAALVLPVLLAEIPARAQELSFRLRYFDRPVAEGGVHERRWWPYGFHVIGYDPATGRWWGDD